MGTVRFVGFAGLQLSVLKRLSFILNTNVKMAALHSFIKSHLQYCPLVWANQSKGWMSFLEKLQERGLRFVYNNYSTPYVDHFRKAHIPSVSTAWQQSAVVEVYKALNGLLPKYKQCMFTLNKTNHNLRSDNKIFFQNVTPQILALNHLHTREEVYGINYQTVLEHVSHWKILRQRLSLGQLTMICDIYILPCILAYLAFVDLTCFRFYMCCCLYLFLNLILLLFLSFS